MHNAWKRVTLKTNTITFFYKRNRKCKVKNSITPVKLKKVNNVLTKENKSCYSLGAQYSFMLFSQISKTSLKANFVRNTEKLETPVASCVPSSRLIFQWSPQNRVLVENDFCHKKGDTYSNARGGAWTSPPYFELVALSVIRTK